MWRFSGFILIFSLGSLFLKAQLPHAEEFCSHAKSSSLKDRTSNFNYKAHQTYDIRFYHLNLWVETENTDINGEVLIKAQSLEDKLDTIFLELTNNLGIQSVFINQTEAEFNHIDDIVEIKTPSSLALHEIFEVSIHYEGKAISSEGRGYNTANSYSGTRVNWTLSEPFYSKDWWPCKQELEDKADSVWVFVTTSSKNKVGSNGILTHTEELENNKVRYEWKSKYPIAYYLISIAVAEYMEYSFTIPNQNGKDVFVQNYLYPDSAMYKSQKTLIDCTYLQMDLLQEKYGDYPFIDEKYGHCITPIGGGMEHQTMTTQRDFSFHLTIHEMGHSWFGNQVTCARWNDIWVNEGFATYTQYLGLEYLADQATADAFMAAMQSVVMREPDGSVFVPEEFTEDRARIFSGRLSYYKGATIIHMIRYLLEDDDLFFHILKTYQQRYQHQTATAEDFRAVLEELSAQDFEEFFQIWYYGEGYPIYDFQWSQNVNGQLKIVSNQKSSTPKTSFFPMKFDLLIYFENGSDSLIQIEQNNVEEVFIQTFPKKVKNILPNPRSQNLMDVNTVYAGVLAPHEILVEPNPCHDVCLLRFANVFPGRKVQVFDSQLNSVYETEDENSTFYLPVNEFSSGLYLIIVTEKEAQYVKKLVKY